MTLHQGHTPACYPAERAGPSTSYRGRRVPARRIDSGQVVEVVTNTSAHPAWDPEAGVAVAAAAWAEQTSAIVVFRACLAHCLLPYRVSPFCSIGASAHPAAPHRHLRDSHVPGPMGKGSRSELTNRRTSSFLLPPFHRLGPRALRQLHQHQVVDDFGHQVEVQMPTCAAPAGSYSFEVEGIAAGSDRIP